MAKLDQIRETLAKITEPELKSDILSLEMVKDLKVEDDCITLRLNSLTPADHTRDQLKENLQEELLKLDGVKQIEVLTSSEFDESLPRPKNAIEGVRQIIAVSSGKGGVGKSTVSVNLACSLAKSGAKVGIMDADIYGPNLPTMLGVTEQPQILEHPERGELFLPPVGQGVKVMSMGFLVDPDQPMIWRGPMLHNMLNQFCHKVEWGELDYLVIDMPPGTGDVQLSIAQLIPITGAVLVSTPQEVSQQDVRKAFYMWEKVNVPVLGVVENMSYFKGDDGKVYHLFGKGGGQRLAEKFGTEVLAELPIVPQVCEGGDIGRPVSIESPDLEVSERFKALASIASKKSALNLKKAAKNNPEVKIGSFS